MTDAASMRYPVGLLLGDYARAAVGLGISLPTLLLADASLWVAAPLGGMAVLCAYFVARTAEKQRQTVTLDDAGVAVAGWRPARLDWAELDRLRLSYYATKRDRSEGWMQLSLAAAGRRISVDSRLEGFPAIARAAADAARDRGLPLSQATLANLEALGIAL